MSYDTSASGDKLTGQFSTAFDEPFSIVVWSKRAPTDWSNAASEFFVNLNDDEADLNDGHGIHTLGTPDNVSARSWTPGGSARNANYAFADGTYDDTWVCIIGVWTNDTDRKIYIENSSQVGTNTEDDASSALVEYIAVGGAVHLDFNQLDGLCAEVAIFDKALSTAEIDALQTAAETGPPPNSVAPSSCIGYWSLDTDQATHADQSGNGGPTLTVQSSAPYSADHPTIAGGVFPAGLTTETSTAFAVGLAKDKAVGLAEEIDSSLIVVPAGLGAPVALSVEVDTALVVIANLGSGLGVITEADSSLTATPMKEFDAVKGVGTDEALTTIVDIAPVALRATEYTLVLPLTAAKTRVPNTALEVDLVLQSSFEGSIFVGLPEEIDIAFSVTPFSLGVVGQAIEIDVPLTALALRSTLVGQTSDASSAFAVTIDTVLVPRDLGWEDDDVTWGGVEIGSKDFAPVYVTDLDFKILGYDASSALDAYIERRAVLSERGAIVLGTAIWPDIQGPTGQPILVSMGAHDTPDGSIDWEGPYAFYIGQDQFVDFAVSGKYLATRFEGAGVSAWTLQSYDVEYEVVGRH